MSHPVFLNATSNPRMPDGSSREWEAFFLEGGPELEANAFIPLLWLALYTPMDLHWARLIDDEDLDSDAREDMMEYGDTQYPYLVTSLERALATLAQRAPLLVERLRLGTDVGVGTGVGTGVGAEAGADGATGAPTDVARIIDNFARHLRLHYGPYVLCRTSGLPDVEEFGPELQKALEDFDALTLAGDAASDNVIVADINRTRAMLRPDRMHLLTGHGHDFTQAEPEPEVVDVELPVDAEVAEPARVTQSAGGAGTAAQAGALDGGAGLGAGRAAGPAAGRAADRAAGASATDRASATAGAPAATIRPERPVRRENKLLGWLVAVAVGVPTVVAYQTTGSIWIAGILFLLLCAAAGWFMKGKA
ncbi:hypothetical protein [Pigmentiphaga litoralis]|uniref:Uncharacterized protein n=1 Tax=Pigmentiphaga litoralis TaxID=516702 RepID=A0A7Y9IY20_9BURK|nr:hypothetical protein [Pigmentiphaga litoralis]NYE26077.1 hypothetical protein [Pigmentiphaga litoralis]NYE85197.1 hypothetical protein [Pigmentiphaga litoralis]